MKKKIILTTSIALGTMLLWFIIYYFGLPAVNFQHFGFGLLIALTIGSILTITLVWTKELIIKACKNKGKDFYQTKVIDKKTGKASSITKNIEEKFKTPSLFVRGYGYSCGVFLVIACLIGIAGTPLFNAKRYAKQLPIEQSEENDFEENFNFDGDLLLPILDKQLAFKAAQAKLSTYGSQYSIDEENFTIISVHRDGKDQLVRVTPLEYKDDFVALNKQGHGSIGYIEVNVVTKETKLVETSKGMKYMPSAVFQYDLDRHIRFAYPSTLFSKKYFEIDDEGNPYWVVPTYSNKITNYAGATSTGTIICNPLDGSMKRYRIGEEPTWVDRVVLDTLVQSQATNALKYKNGFFNTFIGAKKEVFQVSDGYNYFIKNGHTYYVSCITSPSEADQTSIGFLTIDLKTRIAKQYAIPGITEMRAREIAMQHESVKAQQLEATWPILINYKNVPTYFLVLKNDVQECKVVFINVESGTYIAMGNTLDEAKLNYDKLVNQQANKDDEVKTLSNAVVQRVQIYNNDLYFTIEGIDNRYFVASNQLSLDAMFLKEGDIINLTYMEYDSYSFVKSLQRVK